MPVASTRRNTDIPPADPFERIVAALHEAAFDDGAWPRATALIDDACGMDGSQLCVVEVRDGKPEYRFGWFYGHGRANADFEREYRSRFARDERIARLLLMPAGTLFASEDLLDESEREAFAPPRDARQLVARLEGGHSQHIFWLPTRTSSQGAWRPTHLRLLRRLLPHVGHGVRCGLALRESAANAQALAALLDDAGIGAVFLDRFGSVTAANVQGSRRLDRDLLAALGEALDAPGDPAVAVGESRRNVLVRRAGDGAVALLVDATPGG